MVKNPSANAGARVPFLGPEDPLEKEMAAHSSIPAWRIPWTEEPGGQRSHTIEQLTLRFFPARCRMFIRILGPPTECWQQL